MDSSLVEGPIKHPESRWKLKRIKSTFNDLIMQSEVQIPLNSETNPHPESHVTQDGGAGLTASTMDPVLTQQPAKRPTRQWAAWTRQEEESFFAALRQVGKNFEKITCRVQSKNKDQVRHYYYRLVRRMNKLLGPGLCLDAKNSKDTNAAMLRWWSLLEKYSCKASKLHLKPRRFKIFVEALEHQLLKDRKKNVRKRSQGENCSSPSTISSHGRTSGHDNRAVRLVLVDSQNIQKLGSGKPPLKRPVNVGVHRSNGKVESTTMKPARQRRKPGGALSSAAYKKWEKAAIAGVSLVADAAEHLERTAVSKEVENDQCIPKENGSDHTEEDLPPPPCFSKNQFVESSLQASMKLKLQLFPIDDATRRSLEKDNHNPFLELTLSNRKKISSVMEHLNRKWGSSSVACGELMLCPYGVEREKMVGCQRWTQDTAMSAADVYTVLENPPVFRLRYGWFSKDELTSITVQERQAPCLPRESVMACNSTVDSEQIPPSANHQSEEVGHTYEDQLLSVSATSGLACPSIVSEERSGYIAAGSKSKLMKPSATGTDTMCYPNETGGGIMRQLNDGDELRSGSNISVSACEWADSLTNISIGDLLEASYDLHANCDDEGVAAKSPQCMPQISYSCDSFDAAIAAHISRYQNKMGSESILSSHATSIWDAEETCDAFSFQRNAAVRKEVTSMSATQSEDSVQTRTGPVGLDGSIEELRRAEKATYDSDPADPMDECQPQDQHTVENTANDVFGLTDIYWPDSLGPLDLEVPSSKYHAEDLILGDSLSSLNRLMASSLDAFQNCSFFGMDKKDSGSTVEA